MKKLVAFNKKLAEVRCVNKMYCPVPTCSAFKRAGFGVTRSGAFGLELFQQGIGVYRLLYVVTQLQPVQLQQPDGLLQLRRQRQFLCEPDLKRLLNHR